MSKKIVKEEIWCGSYLDDYFLNGGMGGDYNNGFMYGVQHADYIKTYFENGKTDIEWLDNFESQFFKTEEERDKYLSENKDYFLEEVNNEKFNK